MDVDVDAPSHRYWTDRFGPSKRFVCRFEDLVHPVDGPGVLLSLAAFLGYPSTAEHIACVHARAVGALSAVHDTAPVAQHATVSRTHTVHTLHTLHTVHTVHVSFEVPRAREHQVRCTRPHAWDICSLPRHAFMHANVNAGASAYRAAPAEPTAFHTLCRVAPSVNSLLDARSHANAVPPGQH